jgi:hypothetical protein
MINTCEEKVSGGHLHDGGSALNLYINGKLACSSKANYGPIPEVGFITGGHSTGITRGEGTKRESIKNMTECTQPIPVKKGDIIRMDSLYDLNAHTL